MVCKSCGEQKPIKAKGMCNACYLRELKILNPEYKERSYRETKRREKERYQNDEAYRRKLNERKRESSKKIYHKDVESSRKSARERNAKYRATERGKMKKREDSAKRRANAGGKVDYNEVLTRNGYVCGLCGKEIDKNLKHPHRMSLAFDHIIPLAKGGQHKMENIQPSHFSCNSSKRDRVDL